MIFSLFFQIQNSFLSKTLLIGFALITTIPALAGSGPHNLASIDGQKVALQGHDPVAYFTQAQHLMGTNQFKLEHLGATYWFLSQENMDLFKENPEKYAPQFGGYCANGIVYGIPWGGDADTWEVINEKLYIFGGAASKKFFMMNQSENLELAQKLWDNEVKGSWALPQRLKRLVFRVDHYKSGEELQKEFQSSKAKMDSPTEVQ